MPRITMELLRKRCEHNEGEISTLEELSLHQENIEKIELLNQACRDLKILLLQYNLISKIENLHKLKKLEYLNLALNNVEVIENLEGLESLNKLDLTVNFVGDIRGVKTLRGNEHLQQLILTGNPCCDYEGYREYVIATLPQLKELDMSRIERSERIKALQKYAEAEGDVIRGYRKYAVIRQAQKNRRESLEITEITDENNDSADEDAKFWKSTSQHTPEDRVAIARRTMRQQQRHDAKKSTCNQPKKSALKLFSPEGRPYNVNQAKVAFRLNDEDDRENVTLDVTIYKHLDTSFVDVDVQPTYVRVTIKGKILQLTLPCEVMTDKSVAQRNVTTGSLIITMPRINKLKTLSATNKQAKSNSNVRTIRATPEVSKREYLEIGPPRKDYLDDLLMIAKNDEKSTKRKIVDEDFVDNPDVPPLE